MKIAGKIAFLIAAGGVYGAYIDTTRRTEHSLSPGYDKDETNRKNHTLPQFEKPHNLTLGIHGTPTRHSNVPTVAKRRPLNEEPTPAPTAPASVDKTIYINDDNDFALLLPSQPQETIGDAENDATAYCSTPGSCPKTFPPGLITASKSTNSSDGTYFQITGCLDSTKFTFADSDGGGQFDVRFPNGAMCKFGGYGASFIEQVEPSANRFCLRCCASENDQVNCNSHQDREGCILAVPGTYDFPELGVNCE